MAIETTDSDVITLGETLSIDERLVVAPCDGRFRPTSAQHYTAEGEYVLEGQVVGHVTDRAGGVIDVVSGFDGWVLRFLVMDGTPVRTGEPVLCLRNL